MKEYTLVGVDGNAFAILAYTQKAMRECKFSKEQIEKMRVEATTSNHDNLICVCMDYLEKCNERIRN